MLRLNQDGRSVEWISTPGEPSPSLQHIRLMFESSEFSNFCWLDSDLKQGLMTLRTDPDSQHIILVAERRDAAAQVRISADKLLATLSITTPYAGKALGVDTAQLLLQKARITNGLLQEQIADLIKRQLRAKPGERVESIVAKGVAPVAGRSGQLKTLTLTAGERMLRPTQRDDGSVDMLDLGDMITVDPGDELMRRIPPVEGQPGRDVYGEEIPVTPVADVELVPGEGTEIAENDPNLLIASKQGSPVATSHGMQVDDMLVLTEVGVNCGHVRYEGSVFVRGDVHDGMKIEVDGDLQINGVVESATIVCGGSVTVGKGIIGRQQDDGTLSCRITAGQLITGRFARFAELNSETTIALQKEASHCVLNAADTILLGNERSQNGRLIGGKASAGVTLKAGTIGTPAGSDAVIDLGGRLRIIKQDILQRRQVIKNYSHKYVQLVQALTMLKKTKPGSDEIKEVENAITEHKDLITAEQNTLRILEDEIQQGVKNSQVHVAQRLYSQIEVVLGRHKLRTIQEYGPSRITLHEGKLQVQRT